MTESADNSLLGFLSNKIEAETAKGAINWDESKQQYLARLEALYGMIQLWLKPLVNRSQAQFLERTTTLEEEGDSYGAPVLSLHIANQTITFYPKGALASEGKNLVEIVGDNGSTTITYGDAWVIGGGVEFNEGSFQGELQRIMK